MGSAQVRTTDREAKAGVADPWLLVHAGWIVGGGTACAVAVGVVGLFGEPFLDTGLASREAAIGIALKVITGVGALVAGLLAWGRLELSRREHHRLHADMNQRTETAERDREQRESAAHQDRQQRDSAHAATHGLAVKARIDDRFVAAVRLLGDPGDTAVRLGGLYALEAIAQDTDDAAQRQAIYDIICGYLRERTPTKKSAGGTARVDPTAPLATDYQAAAAIALRVPGCWKLNLDLSGTHLANHRATSTVSQSSFDGAVLSNCTFLSGSNISGASWIGATLESCEFEGSTVELSDFSGATIDNSVFRNTVISNCTFNSNATLHDCSFVDGTVVSNCSFISSSLVNATFVGARVEKAAFDKAELVKCTFFVGTRVDSSRFVGSILKECKLNAAEVAGCRFDKSRLEGTLLGSARLSDCSFLGATLARCSLPHHNHPSNDAVTFRRAEVTEPTWISSDGSTVSELSE